jgi:hypothetical protein
VRASFERTWIAVVDQLAERFIPIRTIDRSSGLVVAEESRVGRVGRDTASMLVPAHPWADCGSRAGDQLQPTEAIYNIRVRGDSTSSIVIMTVRFSTRASAVNSPEECSTRGVLEREVEGLIRDRAERGGRTVPGGRP